MPMLHPIAREHSGIHSEDQEPPPSGPLLAQSHAHIQHAESFFGLSEWSQKTLYINSQGHITLRMEEAELDLYNLAKNLVKNTHQSWPVLLRFPALITKNIAEIHQAFSKAIQKTHYKNHYTLAYPLKVNPHASIVKTLMQSAKNHRVTFEVGSKAELLIALTQTTKEQPIICNGFKDKSYITLLLEAAAAGQKISLVFESLDEVELLLTLLTDKQFPEAGTLNLGLRLRLNTPVKGHWENSNGHHSKFGLSSREVLHVIQRLKQSHCLSYLQVMHIHPGSQIVALSELAACFQEGIRYYHELLQLDAPIQTMDIGGGLAIRYSGAIEEEQSDYTLEDYAMAIIEPLASYCEKHHLPHPEIISETGRNTVALSSMLLTDVRPLSELEDTSTTAFNTSHPSSSMQQLWELHHFISSFHNEKHAEAVYLQQDFLLNHIQQEFLANTITLADLAWSETIYQHNQILLEGPTSYQKYVANFSVFQSMPDYWGIQQFFPVLSLHGYHNELTRTGVFYDLTCDSDGVIQHYLHPEKLQSQLTLPAGSVEFIGVFLVGAYQEVMASGHNLFERMPCLDITWNAEKRYFEANTYTPSHISDSLSPMGYTTEDLLDSCQKKFSGTPAENLCAQVLESTSYLDC